MSQSMLKNGQPTRIPWVDTVSWRSYWAESPNNKLQTETKLIFKAQAIQWRMRASASSSISPHSFHFSLWLQSVQTPTTLQLLRWEIFQPMAMATLITTPATTTSTRARLLLHPQRPPYSAPNYCPSFGLSSSIPQQCSSTLSQRNGLKLMDIPIATKFLHHRG